MSDFTLAPRRRSLWRLFIAPVLLLVAAPPRGARSGSMPPRRSMSKPTPGGRAKPNPAGFTTAPNVRWQATPFRLEIRCDDASVSLISQTAGAAAPITAKLGEILVVAQIYDPKLVIAEFKAPATISDRGTAPLVVNWSKGRSSVVGLPGVPQRASIVFV